MNLIRSLTVALLLAGAAVAASGYKVQLAAPTKIGATELKAGEYTVNVDGGKATFTSGKTVVAEAPVTVETAKDKYQQTRVETGSAGLESVAFRGTNMKILVKTQIVQAK